MSTWEHSRDVKDVYEAPGKGTIQLSAEAMKRLADGEYVGPLDIEGSAMYIEVPFGEVEKIEVTER